MLMAKKVGKSKDVEDLAKIELDEGESVVVDGIEEVRIILDRGNKKL